MISDIRNKVTGRAPQNVNESIMSPSPMAPFMQSSSLDDEKPAMRFQQTTEDDNMEMEPNIETGRRKMTDGIDPT